MDEELVRFECAQCGCQCFRDRALDRQMMAECGRVWCLVCAPAPYRGRSPERESVAIADALLAQACAAIAQARATVAAGQRA